MTPQKSVLRPYLALLSIRFDSHIHEKELVRYALLAIIHLSNEKGNKVCKNIFVFVNNPLSTYNLERVLNGAPSNGGLPETYLQIKCPSPHITNLSKLPRHFIHMTGELTSPDGRSEAAQDVGGEAAQDVGDKSRLP